MSPTYTHAQTYTHARTNTNILTRTYTHAPMFLNHRLSRPAFPPWSSIFLMFSAILVALLSQVTYDSLPGWRGGGGGGGGGGMLESE